MRLITPSSLYSAQKSVVFQLLRCTKFVSKLEPLPLIYDPLKVIAEMARTSLPLFLSKRLSLTTRSVVCFKNLPYLTLIFYLNINISLIFSICFQMFAEYLPSLHLKYKTLNDRNFACSVHSCIPRAYNSAQQH